MSRKSRSEGPRKHHRRWPILIRSTTSALVRCSCTARRLVPPTISSSGPAASLSLAASISRRLWASCTGNLTGEARISKIPCRFDSGMNRGDSFLDLLRGRAIPYPLLSIRPPTLSRSQFLSILYSIVVDSMRKA